MAKEIIIVIKPDGTTVVEGRGFTGKACDAAMAPYQEALGVEVQRVNKPEYNQTTENTVENKAK